MGSADTTSYVMVKKDGLDRYNTENVTHKYSKCPAWIVTTFTVMTPIMRLASLPRVNHMASDIVDVCTTV